MILADNETKVDLLNNEAIATTIINLLSARPDRPVTFGVHGDWGAGKSSILEMIEAGLEGNNNALCIKFNGWRFQGFEDAKVALIEGIVTGLLEKRPALTKASAVVKETFKRINWLKIAKKGGGLAWTAFTGIPSPDQIQSITGTIRGLISDPQKLANKENVESALGSLEGLLKPEEAKHLPEEVKEFRKAFDNLLKEAHIDQLVVLIDDLDRCLPEPAIETLEAVRLFVFTERTAFVVAADEAMIEYAVRKHFPELPDTTGPRDYARNYLEKLIQVPFRIPALGETETRIYVTLLLIGERLGEDDPDFGKLIAIARERLKRPWASMPLDAATVKQILGAKAESVQDALFLSDQTGPLLANGTKGNPRQIKRFLNALLLRKRTAEARGFGDDINLPILAKLMLVERFFSPFFDQIASTAAAAANGVCDDLGSLELHIREKEDAGTALKPVKKGVADGQEDSKRKGKAKVPESSQLSGWITSETICSWAAMRPSLADVDLRPYLFVAKDKKDYFGSTSALGKLAIIADRLLEVRIIVEGMAAELTALATPEAAQLFEEVRSRIIGKGEFTTLPSGIDGLRVLVSVHPNLESNLLDLLESLPADHLGPWVVSGWSSSIKSSAGLVRFHGLLAKWAEANNPMLKTAAFGALKVRKTR
mgnify:CR=1 FL=1